MVSPDALYFTPNDDANRLLAAEPLAVLLGMLLDQQVPMEWAFEAPRILKERLGGSLDAQAIAAMDEGALESTFRDKPALHRYPGSMAKRAHALCTVVADQYGGRTEAIWDDAATGDELLARLKELPGFGPDKSRIFVGLLGKRLGVLPPGWEAVAADWASIADVDTYERVAEIREKKRAAKKATVTGAGTKAAKA
ncbi:MAG: HhH-GPD-type base excision DNA repair protein [Actinomycetota bacterium]|nr:HhH-GPD-type base excision DNA repair protein [Actinomycetota bacterium]